MFESKLLYGIAVLCVNIEHTFIKFSSSSFNQYFSLCLACWYLLYVLELHFLMTVYVNILYPFVSVFSLMMVEI